MSKRENDLAINSKNFMKNKRYIFLNSFKLFFTNMKTLIKIKGARLADIYIIYVIYLYYIYIVVTLRSVRLSFN